MFNQGYRTPQAPPWDFVVAKYEEPAIFQGHYKEINIVQKALDHDGQPSQRSAASAIRPPRTAAGVFIGAVPWNTETLAVEDLIALAEDVPTLEAARVLVVATRELVVATRVLMVATVAGAVDLGTQGPACT